MKVCCNKWPQPTAFQAAAVSAAAVSAAAARLCTQRTEPPPRSQPPRHHQGSTAAAAAAAAAQRTAADICRTPAQNSTPSIYPRYEALEGLFKDLQEGVVHRTSVYRTQDVSMMCVSSKTNVQERINWYKIKQISCDTHTLQDEDAGRRCSAPRA